MSRIDRSTIIGIFLLLLGTPIGYLLSELTKNKIAQLQQFGSTSNVDSLTLQALLVMDIGSFLSLVGLIMVSVKVARFIRKKIGA